MSDAGKPTVLLTGATGFLGGHLLRALHNEGYPLVVLKRSGSDTSRIDDVLQNVTVHDIDKTALRSVFKGHSIDAVIHTATCYGRKGESVRQVVDANLMLPLTLIELCTEFNTDTFFNTDTALPAHLNYYALSKKHFLEYGERLAKTYTVRFVNMRLEHMYGPDDDPSKYITFLIQAFIRQQETLDLTAGEQRRDFIYVDDAVNAYLTLLRCLDDLMDPITTFEIGSGEAPLLADIVKLIYELCDSRTKLRFGAIPYRDGEIMRSQADTSAMARLGWVPSVPLREGLARTIEAEKAKPRS